MNACCARVLTPGLRPGQVEREGKWQTWTWNQYSDDIFCAARAFIALGLAPWQSVNIIGFNRCRLGLLSSPVQ